MFIAPLCFVLSLPYLRTPEYSLDDEFADAIIDSAMESHEAIASQSASDDSSIAAVVGDVAPSTRVAMLPPKPSAPTMEYGMPEPRAMMVNDASAVIDMAAINDGKVLPEAAGIEFDVPLPVVRNSPKKSSPPSVASVAPPAAIDPEVVSGTESDVLVMPEVAAGTHFDATAHLAMRNGSLGSTSSEPETEGRVSRRPSKADQRKMRAEMEAMTGGAVDVLPKDGGFGVSPEAMVEQVILQQPLESRMVSRMENVVAVTKAQGWPIALVRSDLPDDYWWVQQMVGIRGNAFAARVNFGNEHSIRGSVYHLTFVFLDSPDEVRRFRIAKQFKELPEGIRRSRKYTFTRK